MDRLTTIATFVKVAQAGGFSAAAAARHAAAGRELRALCELDDHMLSDIGLTRSQLRREAARPFWRASVPSAMTSRSTSLRGDA